MRQAGGEARAGPGGCEEQAGGLEEQARGAVRTTHLAMASHLACIPGVLVSQPLSLALVLLMPEIRPDISPAKMSLLQRELQFGVCNHGEPHKSEEAVGMLIINRSLWLFTPKPSPGTRCPCASSGSAAAAGCEGAFWSPVST